MPTKYQRDVLGTLRDSGFQIENIRQGRGSHLFVRVTGPTGKKAHLTLPGTLGDYRAIKNFESLVRKLK